MAQRAFDYVIIGGGTAGCVLASRLSEDPSSSVLLLEAGPPDRNPWIHIPIGYAKTMGNASVAWQFHTEPEPHMNGRRIYLPQGRTLGGSSAINGLIYTRGQAEDFDRWEALGNPGWGARDVLPYFIRSETNSRGASAYHGGDGPLHVSDVEPHELVDAFIAASEEIGIARNDDFNGPRRPQVRVVFDSGGYRLDQPYDVNLWEVGVEQNGGPSSVRSPVNPAEFGVDPLTLL